MIQVLLFAGFREAIGEDYIQWSPAPLTVADLKAGLQKTYKNLPAMDHVMIAINEEYAFDDMKIQAGDTVAIIPPVSGG